MSSPEQAQPEARRDVRVTNSSGLHARPCHAVVSLAREYDCEFRVACAGREVNGRSILELMTLGAAVGSELSFRATGPGAEELVDRAARLVAAGFDETS
jgi:phosphotransferase system HPr (HPr) family protein